VARSGANIFKSGGNCKGFVLRRDIGQAAMGAQALKAAGFFGFWRKKV